MLRKKVTNVMERAARPEVLQKTMQEVLPALNDLRGALLKLLESRTHKATGRSYSTYLGLTEGSASRAVVVQSALSHILQQLVCYYRLLQKLQPSEDFGTLGFGRCFPQGVGPAEMSAGMFSEYRLSELAYITHEMVDLLDGH
jgi:hypothetical protein